VGTNGAKGALSLCPPGRLGRHRDDNLPPEALPWAVSGFLNGRLRGSRNFLNTFWKTGRTDHSQFFYCEQYVMKFTCPTAVLSLLFSACLLVRFTERSPSRFSVRSTGPIPHRPNTQSPTPPPLPKTVSARVCSNKALVAPLFKERKPYTRNSLVAQESLAAFHVNPTEIVEAELAGMQRQCPAQGAEQNCPI